MNVFDDLAEMADRSRTPTNYRNGISSLLHPATSTLENFSSATSSVSPNEFKSVGKMSLAEKKRQQWQREKGIIIIEHPHIIFESTFSSSVFLLFWHLFRVFIIYFIKIESNFDFCFIRSFS